MRIIAGFEVLSIHLTGNPLTCSLVVSVTAHTAHRSVPRSNLNKVQLIAASAPSPTDFRIEQERTWNTRLDSDWPLATTVASVFNI